DPGLRDMLYQFVKDYAEAQHAIEITNVAGTAAFELILTIIMAAVTGDVGAVAAIGSKAHLIKKFQKVGDLLSDFAKATRKLKLEGKKRKAKGNSAKFSDMEADQVQAKKTDAHGAETGEVSKPAPKTDDITELEPGEKGSWNKELNGELKPNHKYKVGEYLYETDGQGRVSKVSGKLDLNTRDRNTYQQGKSGKEAGIKDGLADDDGGHLIASVFDGAGEQVNYAPMNSNLNRGAWKSMENKWAKALEEGKEVKVDIQPVYEGASKRPSKFIVKQTIDGKTTKKIFKNKSGG
ncbi:MAG: DNA/RNA non-specific endonuclease, partial [Thalassolituus sp.]|uniref:DNA/RNA non-specific endonuclease n=1 Tax=Thalassolituus sp. TaxID=2030822 RepID=UPI003981C2FB